MLNGKRITVTGGAGFLGSYVVSELQRVSSAEVNVVRSRDYDLVKMEDVQSLYRDTRPNVVIHLAAKVGGIGYNRENPGSLFYDNLMMGSQLMEAGRQHGLEKFVAVGTVCSYPKFTEVPFKESDLWNGYPEETNAPYGLAKKMMLVQGQAYRQQYGFPSIYLMPVNLYGPGDNFDPQSSHVIPALIRKFISAVEQNQTEVEVWGSGKATREFLYVEDCAKAIVMATSQYNGDQPINLGSGSEISIRELTQMIAELTGFRGQIVWDPSKPDGQPRRMLDTTRAEAEFGFKAETTFAQGLAKAINFYRKNH